MSLEGWIFMVGIRVFDVGGLIVWLIWFTRLRDEDDEGDDDGGSAWEPPPEWPPPLPDAAPWPSRRRDHSGDRVPTPAAARRAPRTVPSSSGPRGDR